MKIYKRIELFESFKSKVTVIKAPNKIPSDIRLSIFLAGSIEDGKAENWQEQIAEIFKNENVVLYNPRRDDWDDSWKQTIEDNQFNKQVNWELNSMDNASVIIMNFDPSTKSPISLLELGLYASSGKLLVCCPNGFYRKGNVDIVCDRYNIPMFNTIEELCNGVKDKYL